MPLPKVYNGKSGPRSMSFAEAYGRPLLLAGSIVAAAMLATLGRDLYLYLKDRA